MATLTDNNKSFNSTASSRKKIFFASTTLKPFVAILSDFKKTAYSAPRIESVRRELNVSDSLNYIVYRIFAKPLPEAISVLCYFSYDTIIAITKERNVIMNWYCTFGFLFQRYSISQSYVFTALRDYIHPSKDPKRFGLFCHIIGV